MRSFVKPIICFCINLFIFIYLLIYLLLHQNARLQRVEKKQKDVILDLDAKLTDIKCVRVKEGEKVLQRDSQDVWLFT